MKTKLFRGVTFGLLVAGVVFVGGCRNGGSTAMAEVTPVSPALESPQVQPAPVVAEPAAPAAETPPPADISLSANAGQIVKLAQAGVDESVMLSFVKNSRGAFSLGSDEIIYLKDIGVEGSVVTAMIERDRALGVAQQSPAPVATAQQQPYPVATTVTETAAVQQPTQPVTVNNFYNTLSPYGSWVEVEGYGRCWQPTVVVSSPTWQPYCDRGRWVYTDCGWYWNSDYSWGYTTFHYGRWFRHSRFGWCWNPDTVWAPAWVTWRYSNDYCGWAPLPPRACYSPGIGFTYYDRSVSVGFDFGLSVGCFTFLPVARFCDPHPRRYAVSQHNVTKIYNNTTIINNYSHNSGNQTIINHGVPVGRVSAATHTTIKPVTIHETPSAFHRPSERPDRRGNETVLYRPSTGSARNDSSRRTETQTATPTKAVLPKKNPGEERRRTETSVQIPATNPGRTTASPTTERTDSVRHQTGNRTENQKSVETSPATGSRETAPRRAVQPRTSTTVQSESTTRSVSGTTTGNSPIIIGNRNEQQHPTTSTGISAPPATTTRSPSSVYTPPRFESPRVQSEISRPATIPSAPPSTRVERQEYSRPAPVVSHRDTESQNSSAFRRSSSSGSDRGATQSSQSSGSSQSSKSQSRGDRQDKKSKD